jgi:DNA-binding CsgD family transcriptional regulator
VGGGTPRWQALGARTYHRLVPEESPRPDDPYLAGRRTELSSVAAFLEAVGRGPAGLMFQGEPGIGKTALWSRAASRAEAVGYQVLLSRCSEEETPIAGGTLLDLFGEIPTGEEVAGPDEALARGRSVHATLTTMVVDAPLVIAIDDLQWIDGVSGRALRYALRRLRSERVGFLATARSDPDRSEATATIDAFPPGKLMTIDLAPLDLDTLREVLHPVVSSIARPTLRRIHEISGGNPLWAIELARAFISSGTGIDDVVLPTSLHETLAGNLDRAPPTLAPLLEIVAAQGRTSLSELVGLLPGEDVDALLATAIADGLLVVERGSDIRFSHPLLGAAAYARVPPLALRTLHARLADLARDPDVRARHLARSTEEPDERVASLVEQAAERAKARESFSLAAEFAEHSARLTPNRGSDAFHRRIRLQIEALGAGGEVRRALALADRSLEETEAGPERAELLALRWFMESDDTATSAASLRQALDEAGGDARLRCRLLEELAHELKFGGDLPAGIASMREAASLAAAIDDPALRARVNAELWDFELLAGHFRHDLTEEALNLAESPSAPSRIGVDPLFTIVRQIAWRGDLRKAIALLEAQREAYASVDLQSAVQVCYDLAMLDCLAGELTRAAALAREGSDRARDSGDPWAESTFYYPFALLGVWCMSATRAEPALADLRRRAETYGMLPHRIRAHWLDGLLALREGEIEDARTLLTEAVSLLEETGVEHPGQYPVLPDAIEALARSGDPSLAQTLLERLERRSEAVASAWTSAVALRARGALLLARGDAEEALEPLEKAVISLDRLGFRPDAARAVLVRGSALLRSGHRIAAADAFSDAEERFRLMGAPPWAAKASEELERVAPGRTEGELTPTEARVSALVAEGLKNREIAGNLFVSVATVEAHLTRIYRKLGVASRSDLTRLVASGALDLPLHDASPDP